MSKTRTSSVRKSIIFSIVTILLVVAVLELVASYGLLLRLRITNSQAFTKTEPSYFSLFNIPYKAGVKAGLFGNLGFEYSIEFNPKYSVPDPALGYRRKPGKSVALKPLSRQVDNEVRVFDLSLTT